MSLFSYKAADHAGKVVTGTLSADDEKGVVGKIKQLGYVPIQVTPAGKKRKVLEADLSKSLGALLNRFTTKDVMLFTQDLSALLAAGLPVDRALAALIEVTEKERFKEVLKDVLRSVQSGSYLSDAIAKHPGAFSHFYVSMVRAGEAGGVLESVLDRLGSFLETSQELKDYIKSALVYPIFLVFVGGISIIILMTFVIPRFSVIFADLGQAIPLSTRILIGISQLLQSWWWLILLAIGAGVYCILRYVQTPAGRRQLDDWKLRLPMVGDLVRKIEAARFARTLGTLSRSGVSMLLALNLVKDVIGNSLMVDALKRVYERVKEGDRLSKSLADSKIFPSLAVQMITVGEESGRLDEMLLRVAENYEKNIRNTVKRFISFLEPAMILGMGLVVGFIVISMLMAIFSMNDMPL
ncbi:MAG: type II secretion system inner membrane protein GspF [Desulfococcaceae bacterium]